MIGTIVKWMYRNQTNTVSTNPRFLVLTSGRLKLSTVIIQLLLLSCESLLVPFVVPFVVPFIIVFVTVVEFKLDSMVVPFSVELVF